MLVIDNDVVRRLLTMDMTIRALERSYLDLARRHAVCRPRIDIEVPTSTPSKVYRWGTMEGGSTSGYFAIRLKSDIIHQTSYAGVVTQEKYCSRPGLYCGLVLLTSTETGEPLAIINDGVLQHMRVGADGAIGAKALSRENATVLGMLGSGGMARSHVAAFLAVRPIRELKVFSPTPSNREAFAEEMAETHGLEVTALDDPRDVHRGVDILAGCTDSTTPVIRGDWVEAGTHVTNVGGGGLPGQDFLRRVDVLLRFGDAPAPLGRPEFGKADEYLTYAATGARSKSEEKRSGGRSASDLAGGRRVTYAALAADPGLGRTSPDQITYSERGNLQGTQFFALAGRIYELAREYGLGREIPTEWFLQDIRN